MIRLVAYLSLQRHFGVLSKFAHVESRLRGRQRRGKAAFGVPINPCARRVCSRSVAVGLKSYVGKRTSCRCGRCWLVFPAQSSCTFRHKTPPSPSSKLHVGPALVHSRT